MFFDIILQAAAPAIPAGADPTVATALAAVTGIGGIVTAVVGFLKSKEAANFAGALGLAGLRKGTEAKAAVLKLAPEDKQDLIKSLRQEVLMGVKQEETVVAKKPEIDPVKKLPNLPREKFDTKPVV